MKIMSNNYHDGLVARVKRKGPKIRRPPKLYIRRGLRKHMAGDDGIEIAGDDGELTKNVAT
ncbi:hypothetical protein OROGR_030281 [Orobanche gracilis]